MYTITWSIDNLERNTSNGFVTKVHFTCSGTDGEITKSRSSFMELEEPAELPEGFISYESLTEEQVFQWMVDVMGQEHLDGEEENIKYFIEKEKNYVSPLGKPW